MLYTLQRGGVSEDCSQFSNRSEHIKMNHRCHNAKPLLPYMGEVIHVQNTSGRMTMPVSVKLACVTLFTAGMVVFAGCNGGGDMEQQRVTHRPNGTPVVHMWNSPMPDTSRPAMGFPVPEDVSTATVYRATAETGIYSHHPQITYHDSAFHAMWSNHFDGEDGPGQRVIYSRTSDPAEWGGFLELFPAPDLVRTSDTSGIGHTALTWLHHDGRLFAVAGLHENLGFKHPERGGLSPVRTRDFPWRVRRGAGLMAREVLEDGTFGPIFALGDSTPAQDRIAYEFIPYMDESNAELVTALQRTLYDPVNRPAWDFDSKMNFPQGVDSDRLYEPTCYRARDSRLVVLQRDESKSHRMYVSISDDGGATWPDAQPTDIPDTPSLTTSVRAEDGSIILVGNQAAAEFDPGNLHHHYKRDPLVVSTSRDGYLFGNAFALRADGGESRLHGRSAAPGFQYPDAIVHNDTLYVIYSVAKEDVQISWIPLAGITIQ